MISYTMVGRLIRDAEQVTNKQSNTSEKFTIAVNIQKDKSKLFTCYYSNGTKIHNFLLKGRQVMVIGSPNYTTGTDGKEYENIRVSIVELCGKREDNEELKSPPADMKPQTNGPESFEEPDIDW